MATLAVRVGPARVAAALALTLLMSSHDGLAKGTPPKAEDQSAVAQYRESIPTSSGPKLTGTAGGTTRPLPPPVRQTIARETGTSSGLIVKVATSSDYGAPQRQLPATSRGTHPGGGDAGSALAAAPGRLVGSAGRSNLPGLVLVLAAVTVGAAIMARRRHEHG